MSKPPTVTWGGEPRLRQDVEDPRIDLFVSPEGLDLVVAEQARRSFSRFVKEMWDGIVTEPLVWNWHMDVICDALQELAGPVFRRAQKEWDYLIINVPPGTSKSTVCSEMFPMWCWTVDPTIRTVCGSYSSPLSIDIASRSRDVSQSTRYQTLFPYVRLRDDERGKGHFKNTLGGERHTTSEGGTVTGFHGHFIIIDDPLNPQDAESLSEVRLKSANSWIDRTLPSRCIDKSITPTILIMQRLHTDDPTGHILRQAEEGKFRVKHICIPAELETAEQEALGKRKTVLPERMRERYVDRLMDPKRLPRAELERSRMQLGSWGFAGQYDQAPVPLEGGLFITDRLDSVEVVDWSRVFRAVRYWDKAASKGKGCFTVGVLLLLMKDKSYLIADVARGQWSPLTRDQKMLETAQRDGKRVEIWIEQEAGGGGKSDAQASARNLAGYSVHLDLARTAKELRALPYASQMEAGNVFILNRKWKTDYIEEHRDFPNGRFKDQVDASSGAFNVLAAGGGLTW